jgi:concentrative nucleoside transporter, CNT family
LRLIPAMRGLLGIAAILFLAWGLSEDRGRVPWRVVACGVLLQFVLALLFLEFPPSRSAFLLLNRAVEALQRATEAGTGFVFGYLGGGQLPFAETRPGASFIFAFRALPLVLVISALATLLFYWGVLQRVVRVFAWVLRRSVGIGGPLGLGAAVHIFVGHIEAPLLIRPYLAQLARGELFALMSCGMAGIAGTVMVLYAALVGAVVPNALANILIAAVISTPAALAIAVLMVPFSPDPSAAAELVIDDPPVSSIDAIAKGTRDGIGFLLGIAAMLIVTIALVSLIDAGLGLLPRIAGAPLSLQRLFAYAFRPVMWLIGIPGPQTATAAMLMGTKTVLNEFVAYVDCRGCRPARLIPARG